MSSYDSLHSPPPDQMQTEQAVTGDRMYRLSFMRIDNILEDPFTLATFLTSVLAWIITFICSAISAVEADMIPYPNFFWFTIAFMFFLIVGIYVVIVSDTANDYHVAIVGFLAAGLILTSSSVNDLMYTSDPAKEVAAAGFILLSIANARHTHSL